MLGAALLLLLLLLILLLHPFNGFFSRTTWVSPFQKGKTSLNLNEARDDGVLGWHRHQLDHMQTICISLQTDNHTNTPTLNLYSPGAPPDAQPIALKAKECNTLGSIMYINVSSAAR